ncbi:cytochrome P450 [Xylaria castorea]|nr:cytochrome P450 [Xylaria castorea]
MLRGESNKVAERPMEKKESLPSCILLAQSLMMSSVSVLAVFLALVASALVARCIQWFHERSQCRRLVGHQIEKSRQIADFSFLNAKALEDRLRLRAKPNTRLVMAFGLDNSFTTYDRQVHQEFLKRAKNAIRLVHTEKWIKLGEDTRTVLDLCLHRFKDELPSVPLAPMLRLVSFSLVLRVLFDVELSTIDLDEATKATDAINRLWIQSKNRHFIPSAYDKKLLNNALGRLLPHESLHDDCTGPLNLIMPAYETLWRVVLLTFVSIASRAVDPGTMEELQEAVKNVPQCFCKNNDAEMRALAIAKEGLRLYPPTKRIYRAMSTTDDEGGVVVADVEACHRDWDVWGNDALQFKPTRFHNWSHEDATKTSGHATQLGLHTRDREKLSYFPFGVGKHLCPAAAGFGEKMIALLVVELTRRFGTRQTGLEIHFGDVEIQQRVCTPLPSGRSDMENWVLEAKG